MHKLIFLFVVLLIAVIVKVALNVKETFDVAQYLHHKSKCFDCEKEAIQKYGPEGAWLANPAKSFDAEVDAVAQQSGALDAGFLAKTIKYY